MRRREVKYKLYGQISVDKNRCSQIQIVLNMFFWVTEVQRPNPKFLVKVDSSHGTYVGVDIRRGYSQLHVFLWTRPQLPLFLSNLFTFLFLRLAKTTFEAFFASHQSSKLS
jgi:hypothetical protein